MARRPDETDGNAVDWAVQRVAAGLSRRSFLSKLGKLGLGAGLGLVGTVGTTYACDPCSQASCGGCGSCSQNGYCPDGRKRYFCTNPCGLTCKAYCV